MTTLTELLVKALKEGNAAEALKVLNVMEQVREIVGPKQLPLPGLEVS